MLVINLPGEYKRERIQLYDLSECSKLTPICPRSWRNYIKQKRIPAQKINHRWYITADNLRAFVCGARSTHDRHIIPAPDFKHDVFDDGPPDPWEGEY